MRPTRTSRGSLAAVLAGAAALALAGCYTEVGNPGKDQAVTARFRIDYAEGPAAPKRAARSAASAQTPGQGPDEFPMDSVRILQFYLNVVEANYNTSDDDQGRIWKVPDSLGKSVDFTGEDKDAALPPVMVPPAIFTFMKLECRIPAHDSLKADTLDFEAFAARSYIKGVRYAQGKTIRFLVQITNDYKINLVYERDLLEPWRHGGAYEFDFVFFATRWAASLDLDKAATIPGRDGIPIALIDAEHNPEIFLIGRSRFFQSFNSSAVWKENPAP